MTKRNKFGYHTVAWAKANGERVTTNGIEENALGLLPLIAGWCHQGYYLPTYTLKRKGKTAIASLADKLKQQMRAIDWERVVFVKAHFDIAARGYAVISSDGLCYISEQRYVGLLRACLKSVSKEAFDRKVTSAVEFCKAKGIKPEYGSGKLS